MPTTTASEARAAARRWVDAEGSRTPGFAGAFLHGSINWLAAADPVPATSDVDLILVLDGRTSPPKIGKIRHEDVLLDVSSLPGDQLGSAEQVLSQYHLAGSFAGSSVIADPSGRLTALQRAVSRDYAKRHWVRRRCAHARDKVRFGYELRESDSLPDQIMACLFPAAVSAHVLLVAGLRNPTVRNRYVPTRELLREYGRLDVYEALLELLGCADMDVARVRDHLVALIDTFDVAKRVPAPLFPFAADISDAARPVAIGGSKELIDGGNHREAVFWIAVTYSRCIKILQDNPSAGRDEAIEQGYRALLDDLGITSYSDRRQRRQQIEDTLPRVWETAEAIMAAHPGIHDD
jgi:hypothetical protein